MTRLVCVYLVIVLFAATACGSASPQVRVLGVTDTQPTSTRPTKQTLLVFLEVVNPTKLELQLSRLEYQFSAESLFSVDGDIKLSRAVQAGAATVIEVPVQLSGLRKPGHSSGEPDTADSEVIYSFEGRLFATADRVERSWNVRVRGVWSPDAVADLRRAPRARMHIADME